MSRYPVEDFAREMAPETAIAVHRATSGMSDGRAAALSRIFAEPEAARSRAAAIKAQVLDGLDALLGQLVSECAENGIVVHRAADAEAARAIILGICRDAAPEGGVVVKAKSMATEEIHLNPYLADHGYEVVETDLGEFVVQVDGDTPSHIVAPIIHKDRRQVAAAFQREGLGGYTEEPTELAMQARVHLRSKFQAARIGVSGVNFAIAETGRLVLVENEGNNRFSTTAPEVHVALMGIEKLLPRESDLPLFLQLLAGSATGQSLTSYVHLISGPRGDERDGPSEVHLVLLDNGRRRVLEGPYRDILRCIRCGACLNVCPVYRQASGHAYGHVYSGPVGAVLAPAMEGVDKFGALAKASTLCGACEEVCPVQIPIPHLLLRIRSEANLEPDAPWGGFADLATHPWKWRAGLRLLPLAGRVPTTQAKAWSMAREAPRRIGRDFRAWWREHAAPKPTGWIADPEDPVERSVPLPTVPDSDEFEKRLRDLGGQILPEAALPILLGRGPGWADEDALPFLPSDFTNAGSVWEAEIGVCVAELAIAQTGSLVIRAGAGRNRLTSLAPPVNVVLVHDLVPSLEEAFARIPKETSVIVTGTSRTADIEGVLVRGVHGPRELYVVRI